MVVLGWIGCSLSGGCATLWMIRMFTWGRRAATACVGNHSTSARYPVARERERGVRAFKAVVVFHASRRRVLAQRGIPTAHYSHLSLSESWFFVLSDRSTRARSRSRYGRTDGLGVTRAAKQLIIVERCITGAATSDPYYPLALFALGRRGPSGGRLSEPCARRAA